jgi:hypothetical protein
LGDDNWFSYFGAVVEGHWYELGVRRADVVVHASFLRGSTSKAIEWSEIVVDEAIGTESRTRILYISFPVSEGNNEAGASTFAGFNVP